MGTTSQALAAHFESKLHDAVSLLRTLDDMDWEKVTEAEQWTVGVTAHHYASILEPVGELVRALAAGQAPKRFTRATLDEMNAQHVRDHAHCTRAETIALLERSGASTAAVLRGLTDEQLAKHGTSALSISRRHFDYKVRLTPRRTLWELREKHSPDSSRPRLRKPPVYSRS